MNSGVRVGSIVEIPLLIDRSWLVIMVLLTTTNALTFAPRFGIIPGFLAGFVMALLLFASVLLHELGHSVVAQSQGIKVLSITLFCFGGVAAIERESSSPGKTLQVAIAGPAVSLILFCIFSTLTPLFPSGSLIHQLAVNLATINLALALFNMIPGLPLDGGQVLKAIIWQITGDRIQGFRWAAYSGKLLGGVAIATGLTLTITAGQWGGLWMALIGGFIWRNANRYGQLTNLQGALLKLVAADAMTRDSWDVTASTLRQSISRFLPVAQEHVVQEQTPLLEVIKHLERSRLRQITVLTSAGYVAGVIDRGDVVNAVARQLKVPLSEGQIQQIKLQGIYPQQLPLVAIAQTIAPIDVQLG
ncbi:site-2 protease family protein [Acaryochloris thomasi]|nr:site-2 protease family protein [Acaryochloris thomasi]